MRTIRYVLKTRLDPDTVSEFSTEAIVGEDGEADAAGYEAGDVLLQFMQGMTRRFAEYQEGGP